MPIDHGRQNDPTGAEGPLDDRALLLRIRAGDSSALDGLVDRYWTPLVSYAARLLGSWDAAEDVAQGTFVRIWERRHDWESDGSVSALLYRITRNQGLDEIKRRERAAARSRARDQAARRVATPSEQLEVAELEAAFEATLAALAERRREVFILARAHGLSYREIAEVMGIAPQTVANHLSAALAELRQALEPFLEDTVHTPGSATRRAHLNA